jgi:hypothetical protein
VSGRGRRSGGPTNDMKSRGLTDRPAIDALKRRLEDSQ